MRKIKISIYVVCIITLLFCFNCFAQSYPSYYTDFSYYTDVIKYDLSTISGNYQYAMNDATWDWNNPPAPSICEFLYDSTSNNKAYSVASLGNGGYGFYQIVTYNTTGYHRTTKFYIKLAVDTLGSESQEFKRSTACHELGHAMGLNDHTYSSYPYSIMYKDRNRNTVYDPFVTDCYNIQDCWDR